MNDLANPASNRPMPISNEEFDRKIEAGENIDDHLDWNNVVEIMPGELSPEQKAAVQTQSDAGQAVMDAGTTSTPMKPMDVSLPTWALDQLQRVATLQGISREDLARLMTVQQLDKQKIFSA